MEKPPAIAKSKIKFLMFLPNKAASSTVKLHNHHHPFSPGNNKVNDAKKLKSHQNKGFSGPITSIVLEEARNKSKNSIFDNAKEPTSPKISCMGQIKHKKKKMISSKNKSISLPKEVNNNPYSSFSDYLTNKPSTIEKKKKKKFFSISSKKIFSRRRKSDASSAEKSKKVPDGAPSLNQMKRFTSRRDTFANFDWTAAQVVPEEPDNYPRYYSDEEKRDSSEEEEDEVIIPFSAPILLGEVGPADHHAAIALEPRKEINLWKRRTMAQPKTLQLNTW
ncbi:hypothetical protein ACH5RR_027529 [Cinchona calisaya]|uniref:Syringolide-induced protein 14-1-1 n=1 Tax=Cinchona calisaya TaxID=153742 RepID=A0ABD2Z5P7_9GENT